MSVVADLAAALTGLSPIEVIDDFERGVEYRRGLVNRTALLPGWYVRAPFGIRRIVSVPIKPQWIDLPFQSLETHDGVAVTLSVNLAYQVEDAVVWQNDTQDAEQTLMNLTRPAIADVVTATLYDVMRLDLDGTAKRIARKIRHPAHAIGAKVLGAGFTDFVRARNYRLLQDAA